MTAADNSHRPDALVRRRGPARVDSSTRVNVALPFSQFKIQEPSDHLVALTALVEELADLVADAVPSQQATALRRRAHELASQVC
jgi:DNA primase